MKLETINAIAQLIAAICVVASLFYLAVQIRQTRSQKSVVVDSLTRSLMELLGPQAHDVEFTRAFTRVIKDWDGASDEDRARTVAVLLAVFKLSENAWFQKRQGTLDAQQWEGWDAYARNVLLPSGSAELVAIAARRLRARLSRLYRIKPADRRNGSAERRYSR